MVYCSVGGAELGSGVPHFESKYRIEQFVREAVPVAFVRPTFFMEKLSSVVQRSDEAAILSIPLPKDIALQMVSVQSMESVAAALLIKPPTPVSVVEIAPTNSRANEWRRGSPHASVSGLSTGRCR